MYSLLFDFLIMSAYYTNCELIFGKGFKHSLPDGWILKESEKDWAKAIDTSGQVYFLSSKAAYRERVAVEGMLVEFGEAYIDLENGVSLSNVKEQPPVITRGETKNNL